MDKILASYPPRNIGVVRSNPVHGLDSLLKFVKKVERMMKIKKIKNLEKRKKR
jgi:hypothetical protein